MGTVKGEMVVGLDIGTSKIACIVGQFDEEGMLHVLGMGTHPSHGIKRGVVTNIDSTTQSIQRAVQEAELMSGSEIHSVHVGIAGSHINAMSADGVAGIPTGEVRREDIASVIDSARARAIVEGQQILHVIPREFRIDDLTGIREPLGLSGTRLEGQMHIIRAAQNAVRNLERCIQGCGLGVDGIVLEQLASSSAVLSEEERELGVCLVDIGAGTTDIVAYIDGGVRHTAVIALAGEQVTNDIAMALHTPSREAESVKLRYGCALARHVEYGETISVPGLGDRPARSLSRQTLAAVIEPRYEELLLLVREELRLSGLEERIAAGVVLTGGASRMEGLCELAEEILGMPVRVGAPREVAGLEDMIRSPVYATGVGLLHHARVSVGLAAESEPEPVTKRRGLRRRARTRPKDDAPSRSFNPLKAGKDVVGWIRSQF